jgi:hypothetical protein
VRLIANKKPNGKFNKNGRTWAIWKRSWGEIPTKGIEKIKPENNF